jgi:hypothetical protein
VSLFVAEQNISKTGFKNTYKVLNTSQNKNFGKHKTRLWG